MLKSYRILFSIILSTLLFSMAACAPSYVKGPGLQTMNHSTVWLKRLQKDGVQVIQTGDSVRIIILSDRIFYPDSVDLKPDSYQTLADVASFIQRYGNVQISVVGHTDNVHTYEHNLISSKKQALNITSFLWAHGIPDDHLYAKGMAGLEPIATNISPAGSAFNRRIEILLRADISNM